MSATLSKRLERPKAISQSRPARHAALWTLSDVLTCALAVSIGVSLLHGFSQSDVTWRDFLEGLVAIPGTVALLAMWGSYRSVGVQWNREIPALLASTVIGCGVAAALAAPWASDRRPTAQFLSAWVPMLPALLLGRLVRQRVGARTGEEELPVVIVGTPDSARRVYYALTEKSRERQSGDLGIRVAAIFADSVEQWPEATQRHILLSETQWSGTFAECCGIQHAIVSVPAECDSETQELFEKSAGIFKHLLVAPLIAGDGITVTSLTVDKNRLALQVGDCAARSELGLTKRVVDLAAATALAFLSLPFIALAAIAIRASSKGSLLYRQRRIGKANRAFTTLKFRTMYVNADERLRDYLANDTSLRRQWESVHKLKNDPRVTPVGRFLRRFSLDELPQIWNVIAGDMSLVGPRPIVVAEIEKYGRDYAAYEAVRPGLTGLWQVSGRNNTTYAERVNYDSYYVRNWSFWLDVLIVVRTFRAVVFGAGAY